MTIPHIFFSLSPQRWYIYEWYVELEFYWEIIINNDKFQSFLSFSGHSIFDHRLTNGWIHSEESLYFWRE